MQDRPAAQLPDPHEHVRIPAVWLVVLALVGAGVVVHVLMAIFGSGGLVVWPFVFAVSVLLIVNDASDQNAVGVPPFQAYGLFLAVLAGFFVFVALVSTINPWLVILLTLAAAAWLVRDWKQRRAKRRELERRRLAGLCVRCLTPVGNGLDDVCPSCDLPVNPDRLNLFYLARAVANQARPVRSRQVLTGKTPSRAQAKLQRLQQQRAARYGRGKR